MRRAVIPVVNCRFFLLAALLMSELCAPVIAQGAGTMGPPALLTNLFQLRRGAEQQFSVVHPFRIVADVLDADAEGGVLAMRDASGIEFIQLDLRGQKIEPGDRVCLEGTGCGVKPKGFGLVIISGMVVDNDGLHAMAVESGEVFLHPGIKPISVQWFNRIDNSGLSVEYQGPGLPRQPIPGSVLSRATIDPATGRTNFQAGLDYRYYEGAWGFLPDFAKLRPVKNGVATNFDLNVRTRTDAVGLEFGGFITIPRDGVYTFFLASDDGSRLSVGESSLTIDVLSNGPAPRVVGEVPATLLERNSRPWVTLEGTANFAGVRKTGGEMAMRVGKDDIRVEIFESDGIAPLIPLNTKVRVSGIYEDVVAEDGSRIPGMMLVSGWKTVQPSPALEAGFSTAPNGAGETNRLAEQAAPAAATPPTIATAAEIKSLPAERVRQQLPVSIRGVVTAVLPAFIHGVVVQDTTGGIFISVQDSMMRRGEVYQIDGVTGPGSFAPLVIARRITHLGTGPLPHPLRPTWDQLFNGSLDTQYVEIEGVVSVIHDQGIEILTENGKVALDLNDFQPEDLEIYKNALVRIRGCAFAVFNPQTHELETSSLRILGGAMDVLEVPPRDLFDAPQKNLGELLLFDPKTAPFRRLKVGGQVVYGRAGEYFLTDGTNGMHVSTRNTNAIAVGDLVEAVGFLELGGPVAGLKEAVIRKTGRAPLPAPKILTPEQLLSARDAGMLVRVDATLMNQWQQGSEQLLELQSGLIAFWARINSQGRSISAPPLGSRLELTGVYSPQGSRVGGGTVSGFELLLDSPAGIRTLETPPWWTLKRMLVLVGLLAALLFAALVWNKELQWKVQERSRQLETEIQNRQRAELQRAAEAERSRIARDLHDELGTGLTEVSLLASTGAGQFRGGEKSNDHFRVIAEKARALVSGLDVIVWAIDPKRNSLQSFADYLGRYATELFSASDIVCRFNIPIECNAVTLKEAARHSLFLAVKEALNNVIRHASATEVELQIFQLGDRLQVVIADNGRGFDWNTIRRGNGLTNLHERLEALNGRCHIESQVGKGTTVKFIIPLPRDPSEFANKSHDIT